MIIYILCVFFKWNWLILTCIPTDETLIASIIEECRSILRSHKNRQKIISTERSQDVISTALSDSDEKSSKFDTALKTKKRKNNVYIDSSNKKRLKNYSSPEEIKLLKNRSQRSKKKRKVKGRS